MAPPLTGRRLIRNRNSLTRGTWWEGKISATRRRPLFNASNPDQCISGNKTGELFFREMLCPLRSHRQHEISRLATGIPNADICGSGQLKAHLGQQSAGFADDACAVWRSLVPIRRQAQQRPRGARTLRANNYIVRCSRVLDGDHLPALESLDPKFFGSGCRIGEEALPKIGIDPCPRHDPRTVERGKLLHGTVRQRFGFARLHQSAVNEFVAQGNGSPFNWSRL
jgi:hypothetical protein